MDSLGTFIILPINGDDIFRYIPNLIPLDNLDQKIITTVEKSSPQHTEDNRVDVSEPTQVIPLNIVDNSDQSNDLELNDNNISLLCAKCDKSFGDLHAYQKHVLSHQEEKLFNCSECCNGYNIESNFKIHMALHADSLTCPICDLKFQRKASLKSHLAVHQVEEFHSCPECSTDFDNSVDLKKHMKIHLVEPTTHQNELTCNYCKVKFDTAALLRQHVASHVQIKKLVLNRNGKKNKQHQIKNKERKHKCSVCDKTFIKFSLLERHTRIHSGERPYVCEICDKAFTQKSSLQIHLTKHSGIKPFSCTLCPAKFNQKGNLKVHVFKTHLAATEDEKIFKCTECDCIFKKVASLNGHMTKVHAKDTGVISVTSVINQLKNLNEQWDRTVSKSPNDSEHLKPQVSVHQPTDNILGQVKENGQISKVYPLKQKFIGTTKVYICSYCDKETKKPSDLIKHIRVHTKEKPYKCHCGNVFSLKSTLLSHMQTHKGKIGRKCLKCSKVFFSAKTLHSHSRIHDSSLDKLDVDKQQEYQNTLAELHLSDLLHKKTPSEKPQKCNLCSASFMRKVNLQRHMLLHTGERKYKCETCSRSFVAAYSLKEHMKIHTGIRDFGCALCDKKFMNKSLLKRHLQVHDPKKPHQCSHCKKDSKNVQACTRDNIPDFQMGTPQESSIMYDGKTSLSAEITDNPTTVLELNANGEIVGGIYNAFQQTKDCAKDITLKIIKNNDSTTLINPTAILELAQNSNMQTIFLNYPEGQSVEPVNNYFFSQLQLQPNDTVVLNSGNDLNQSPIVFDVQTIGGETLPILTMENESNQNNHTDELISLLSNNSSEELLLKKNHETLPSLDTVDNLSQNDITDNFLANNISLYPNSELNFDNSQEIDGNEVNDVASGRQECAEVLENEENVDGNLNILNASWENCEESVVNLNILHCTVCKRMFEGLGPYQSHICMKSILKKNDDLEASTESEMPPQNVSEEVPSVPKSKTTEKKHFVCVYCGKEFQRRALYMRHINLHKKGGSGFHKCHYCEKQFKKPSDLGRHLRIHTGEKPFACDQCEKKFSLKSTLDSHQKTHNPTATKDFVCEVCNTFFSSKSSRKIHMLAHTGVKRQKCSFCDEQFRTRAHKRSHEQKMHINSPKSSNGRKNKKITNILAEAAEMAINAINEDRMLTRDATDMSEIKVSLELSDQTIPELKIADSIQIDQALLQQWQSSILLQSIDQDMNQPSVIELDGNIKRGVEEAVVGNMELFITHMDEQDIDTERNLECVICQKTYASKDVLRKHMQLHLTKKHSCGQCSKSFSSLAGLTEHEKLHSGYRPYSCFLCTNSFAESHHLKVHLKRIHQIVDTSFSVLLKMSTEEKLDI